MLKFLIVNFRKKNRSCLNFHGISSIKNCEKQRVFNVKCMKSFFFFLLFFFVIFSQKAHAELTEIMEDGEIDDEGTVIEYHVANQQSACQSRFRKHQCQKMIDNSPEIPREYFLNCSQVNKQVIVSCLKAAGGELMVGTVSGAIFYGATKGLGLLGVSTLPITSSVSSVVTSASSVVASASSIAAPAAIGIVVIGGVGYGALKVVESADKSCRKNNKVAMDTAWLVYASYHNKKLADSYRKSNTCARFLSIARRKTKKILGQIQKKKIMQERYEKEKKFIEEKFSSDPVKKKRYLWRISRTYPDFKRELDNREKRFLAALEKIQKNQFSNDDSGSNIEETIASLKDKYQCSSGQYLAELACGKITAYSSMATGLLTGGSLASIILRKTAKEKASGKDISGRVVNNYVKGKIGENTNQALNVVEEEVGGVRRLLPGVLGGTLLRRHRPSPHYGKEVSDKKGN